MQSTTGHRRVRARDVLVVCQVAFSFVLLIGAGLMMRSFSKLRQVDPGFVAQRVLAVKLSPNWSKPHMDEAAQVFSAQLTKQLGEIPGVLSAATASSFPMDPDSMRFGGWVHDIVVEGHEEPKGERPVFTAVRSASADYFKTLAIPLLNGRIFREGDYSDAPKVVIVNQTMARHYWPGENPLGKRISGDRGGNWSTVVGVVGDVKELGLDRETADEMYIPQGLARFVNTVLVRTAQDGGNMANAVRKAIHSLEPETAIATVQTLEEARRDSIASPRVMTDLLGIFAGLALAIAACGIGGILALTVNQRLNEIGIRIALGAKPADVLAMILQQGMLLVVIGLALGAASALTLTGMMTKLLFQVGPTDPVTFVGVSVVLASAALLACYVPARRALRIDPLLALRQE